MHTLYMKTILITSPPLASSVLRIALSVMMSVMRHVILFLILLSPASAADALRCLHVNGEPTPGDWENAAKVMLDRGPRGEASPLPPTEVRTLWSDTHLYVRFKCPFRSMYLRDKPDPATETFGLWDYDVTEVFVGSDYQHIGRYKEFEVSPQNDWVDLEVDRERKGETTDWKWNSGFTHHVSIDKKAKVWVSEMAIPLKSIPVAKAMPGTKLRINFYRIEDKEPNRIYFAWRPTGERSFHVPAAFGELELVK